MASEILIYVGTYTEAIRFGTGELFQGQGEGIHIFSVDLTSGALEPVNVVKGVKNPSYLSFDPSGRFLYAVNELKSYEGGDGGTVSAFSVSADGRDLGFLNLRPTRGTDTCHVATDNDGRFAMVANFMSGSVSVYPIGTDGKLGKASDFVQHTGSSVNPARQAGPHAHSSVFDPANRFVFVPDLGADRVVAYRFDSAAGKIAETKGAGAVLEPGSGPRHIAFSPDGRFAHIVNELDSTVTVFAYNGETGGLSKLQTVTTLPDGFAGENSCADLNVHPTGKFLYASNRGHDSVVAYKRDAQSGRLTLIGHESSGGKTPRNFAIDPTGALMLVANQASDNIVAYLIDRDTGVLKPTGHVTAVGTPVCVKFAR